MRIINIIETSITNAEPILGVTSFGVFEEQLSQEVVEQAEKHFTKCAVENGADENDIDVDIENGYFSKDGYTVSIVWSNI